MKWSGVMQLNMHVYSQHLANTIHFWVLNRAVVSITRKPFRESRQADHKDALRVVTARVRCVLSGSFTSPNWRRDDHIYVVIQAT